MNTNPYKFSNSETVDFAAKTSQTTDYTFQVIETNGGHLILAVLDGLLCKGFFIDYEQDKEPGRLLGDIKALLTGKAHIEDWQSEENPNNLYNETSEYETSYTIADQNGIHPYLMRASGRYEFGYPDTDEATMTKHVNWSDYFKSGGGEKRYQLWINNEKYSNTYYNWNELIDVARTEYNSGEKCHYTENDGPLQEFAGHQLR